MLLSQEAFDANVNEIKNSREKRYLIAILEDRILTLHQQLEEVSSGEVPTALCRGGILQIRELIDYIE